MAVQLEFSRCPRAPVHPTLTEHLIWKMNIWKTKLLLNKSHVIFCKRNFTSHSLDIQKYMNMKSRVWETIEAVQLFI